MQTKYEPGNFTSRRRALYFKGVVVVGLVVINRLEVDRTSPFLFQFFGPLGGPPGLLLLLLTLAALVEVLNHHAHEHVEHKEADEEEERDEVDQAPFVVILLRLQRKHTGRISAMLQTVYV